MDIRKKYGSFMVQWPAFLAVILCNPSRFVRVAEVPFAKPTSAAHVTLRASFYVPASEGRLYLAVVLDLFTRKILDGRCVPTSERN